VVDHLRTERQMVFLCGPRQVGKTVTSRAAASEAGAVHYFNWDSVSDRALLLQGPDALADRIRLDRLQEPTPVCVLDEIHKAPRWKSLLKGIFDTLGDRIRIVVTGSSRLDIYRRGGDSLMGRYFPYRMHPLSVGELSRPERRGTDLLRPPRPVPDVDWSALLKYGGYPEPFVRRTPQFWLRWRNLRSRQLLREDVRGLAQVQELDRIELLAELVRQRAGQLMNYSTLAGELAASVDSVRRWLAALEGVFYAFRIRPWHNNVTRGLRKTPKAYLWDWSLVSDAGQRFENLVACALLKSVHFWNDVGLGTFDLAYVRDKEKREVDFLVVRDDQPWFLVEAKLSGDARPTDALRRFHDALGTKHAFQVALELDFVKRDCFGEKRPTVVPARTLLSQLV
jgi:predicted AAA+ superfamily ATPase